MVLQIFGRHRAEPAFLSCRPGAGRRAERRAPVGERRRLRAQGHVPGAEGPEGLTRKRRGQKAGGGGSETFFPRDDAIARVDESCFGKLA